jgi:dephospho-CoA kinase
VIGLTGGIAAGKSTVSRMLADLGAAIVDADALTHNILSEDPAAVSAIIDSFGREVCDGQKQHIDRCRLARIVFADTHLRRRLEMIIHPRVSARAAAAIVTACRAAAPVVVFDAALLVETGGAHAMDGVVVVEASPAVRIDRLMHNKKISRREAEARIRAQLNDSVRRENADWVVDNDGDLAALATAVDALWRELIDMTTAQTGWPFRKAARRRGLQETPPPESASDPSRSKTDEQ